MLIYCRRSSDQYLIMAARPWAGRWLTCRAHVACHNNYSAQPGRCELFDFHLKLPVHSDTNYFALLIKIFSLFWCDWAGDAILRQGAYELEKFLNEMKIFLCDPCYAQFSSLVCFTCSLLSLPFFFLIDLLFLSSCITAWVNYVLSVSWKILFLLFNSYNN